MPFPQPEVSLDILEGSAQSSASLWSPTPTPTSHSPLCIQSTTLGLYTTDFNFYFFLFKNRDVFSLSFLQNLTLFFLIRLLNELEYFNFWYSDCTYSNLYRPSTPGVLIWQFSRPPNYLYQHSSGLLLTIEINYFE